MYKYTRGFSSLIFLLVLGAIVLVGIGYAGTARNELPTELKEATVEESNESKIAVKCATHLDNKKLVESTIYVGHANGNGAEIAPEEDGTYDLRIPTPDLEPYYLVCYYGTDPYVEMPIPKTITKCSYEETVLICS
jgi:hypothetical protein